MVRYATGYGPRPVGWHFIEADLALQGPLVYERSRPAERSPWIVEDSERTEALYEAYLRELMAFPYE